MRGVQTSCIWTGIPDALDRTVGLSQQRSGGRRPPLNPVTVRRDADPVREKLAEPFIAPAVFEAEGVQIAVFRKVRAEEFAAAMNHILLLAAAADLSDASCRERAQFERQFQ